MSPASTPSTHEADADERNAQLNIYVNTVHRNQARVSVCDSIDGQAFSAAPGSLTRRIRELYKQLIEQNVSST